MEPCFGPFVREWKEDINLARHLINTKLWFRFYAYSRVVEQNTVCSEKCVWTSGFWLKCQNDKFYLSLSLVNAFWMPCPLSGKHNTQLSAGYPVDFQRIYCRFPGDIQWTFSRYPDIGFCALNPYWVLKVKLSRIFLPRKAVPYLSQANLKSNDCFVGFSSPPFLLFFYRVFRKHCVCSQFTATPPLPPSL